MGNDLVCGAWVWVMGCVAQGCVGYGVCGLWGVWGLGCVGHVVCGVWVVWGLGCVGHEVCRLWGVQVYGMCGIWARGGGGRILDQ